jgi:hypothetical protein
LVFGSSPFVSASPFNAAHEKTVGGGLASGFRQGLHDGNEVDTQAAQFLLELHSGQSAAKIP